MYKAANYDTARKLAEENHCAFGLSVIAPVYYVGTKDELDKLPVVICHDYKEN